MGSTVGSTLGSKFSRPTVLLSCIEGRERNISPGFQLRELDQRKNPKP